MTRLAIDWVRCDGHGLCAALLPEVLDVDDWGYPVVRSDVAPALVRSAAAAVSACPALALRLLHD